jgi:hypothetical protein
MDKNRLDEFLKLKPKELIPFFKEKTGLDEWNSIISPSTFKLRQGRFTYKSGYDYRLYHSKGKIITFDGIVPDDGIFPCTGATEKKRRKE